MPNATWSGVYQKFITDFASVPHVFRGIVVGWGKYGNAAIIHDYLYWIQEKPRNETDLIMRHGMKVFGVHPVKMLLIYWAVSMCRLFTWRGNIKKKQSGYNRVATRWPEKATEKPEDLQSAANG